MVISASNGPCQPTRPPYRAGLCRGSRFRPHSLCQPGRRAGGAVASEVTSAPIAPVPTSPVPNLHAIVEKCREDKKRVGVGYARGMRVTLRRRRPGAMRRCRSGRRQSRANTRLFIYAFGACLCRRLSGASGARTPRWSVPTVHSTTVEASGRFTFTEASGRFTFTEASRRFTPTARPLQVNVGGKSLMLGCCCSRILLLFCCYCCNSSTLFSPQR